MKRMKKLFAILMTMAMVMGLGITGFAAESTNVTITVDNAEGATVKYVQIVKADTSSTDGWAYVDTYASYFTGVTIKDLVSIGEGEKDNLNYYSQNDKINDSAAYKNSNLAEALEEIKDDILDGTLSSETVLNNSFTVGAGGLYVLIPEKENYTYSPTLVYVPVNRTENITVDVKGESDQVTKNLVSVTGGDIVSGDGTIVDGDDSVTADDIVEYKVTMKYPYFSDGAKDKTFKIEDTLTNGTFIKDTVEVKVDGKTAAADSYTVMPTPIVNNQTTEITITFVTNKYDPTLAGKDVEVTYSVKVNADVASNKPLSNKVVSTIGTNSTQSIVKSDTVAVEFDKVNGEDDKLIGAVFALYERGTSDKLVAYIADAETTEGISLPDECDSTKLKADGEANGTLKYDGLDANKSYYVQEIVAPDGYKLVNTKYDLTPGAAISPNPTTYTKEMDGIMTTYTEYQYNDFIVNAGNGIVNTKLSALPSTGGMGTTIFTIAGCVIMISAAGLFFASRRKAN